MTNTNALTTYARQTATDNDVDYSTAVRMMGDEPGEVARETGVDAASVSEFSATAPTEDQIDALRTEAAAHGDTAQVRLCDAALSGDRGAAELCHRALLAASAQ